MSAPRRRGGPPDIAPYVVCAGLGVLLVVACSVWAAATLAHALTAAPAPSSANPITYLIEVVSGQTRPPERTPIILLVAEAGLLTAAVVGGQQWWRRRRGTRSRVDVAARHMANRTDLQPFSRRGAAATAQRLGAKTSSPGVLVGTTVNTGQKVYGTWEDMHVDIWGPRTGKTTSRAIPAILEAPGPVVVTSNKRDVVDGTRLPRQDAGDVWVFDPQKIVKEPPAWWWDPLSYVVDVETAAQLAAVFAAYSRQPGAKTDGYFDPEGEALLAWMLLAAAEAKEPITTVYRWLSKIDLDPIDILQAAGHTLPAEHVQGVINYPDKQRAGIFGTARKSVGCLVNPAITRWVTPDPDNPERPQFKPEEFVRRGGTLYLLSREGRGTAGPLVTALTVATIEAAEAYANSCPAGRLPIPMLGVLDEAANVCRWKELPDLYSHFGSRAIILMTILQSWVQGVEVWGDHGMAKLWSSANIRVYGGGVSDAKYLGDLTQFIGEYEPTTYSTTIQSGRGHHSHSTNASTRQEKILDVADMAALPRGRAVVFPSGAPPVLIRTQPWQAGPHAQKVRASLARYAPAEELPTYELEEPDADEQ